MDQRGTGPNQPEQLLLDYYVRNSFFLPYSIQDRNLNIQPSLLRWKGAGHAIERSWVQTHPNLSEPGSASQQKLRV